MFSNVFMTIKIAFISRNSIIKQFKCDLGNKRFLCLCLFCFIKNGCPLWTNSRKRGLGFLFGCFVLRLQYINSQLITHNKHLKVIQGEPVTSRKTKLSISGRVCLKGRNRSYFPQLWSDLFSRANHEVFSVCGKFSIIHIHMLVAVHVANLLSLSIVPKDWKRMLCGQKLTWFPVKKTTQTMSVLLQRKNWGKSGFSWRH